MSNSQVDELKTQGNTFFKAGKFEEAIEKFTAALELDPNHHVCYSNRSGCYARLGDGQKALEDAEKCITVKPDWAKGYSRKGAAYQLLNNSYEAKQAFEKCIELDPNNAVAKQALSQFAPPSGASEPGMGDFASLFSNPEIASIMQDPEVMQILMDVQTNPQNITKHLQNPKFQMAMQVLQPILSQQMGQMDPSQFGDSFRAEPTDIPSTNTHSEPKVEPKVEPVTETEPEPVRELTEEEKIKSRAEEIKNEGNQLYKQKRFDEAIAKYNEAAELDPTNPVYILNQASVYISAKDFDAALMACDQAQEVAKEHGKYDYLAKIYARKGNAFVAMEEYEQAMEMYDKSLMEKSDRHVRAARTEAKNKLRKKSAEEYINPELSDESNTEGGIHFRAKEYQKALECYDEAIKRNPESAKAYANKAAVLMKLGYFERAIKECDECLKHDVTFLKAYVRKGQCYACLKLNHKAHRAFTEGMQHHPGNADLQAGLNNCMQFLQKPLSEEDQKRIMTDEEISRTMNDPNIQKLLMDFQNNQQTALAQLQANPGLMEKFNILVMAGIIRTGP
eukprot:TRINITY_DN2133_c0_g1_i1.p1 TRINITY_DN2133_c0_g1~~TRINITY_DN2133_c0_g1_i1.p1  ORF type:complete len:573 (-),score=168.88 TRINITY_DN2133_c0_g1_i1:1830-3518(-)